MCLALPVRIAKWMFGFNLSQQWQNEEISSFIDPSNRKNNYGKQLFLPNIWQSSHFLWQFKCVGNLQVPDKPFWTIFWKFNYRILRAAPKDLPFWSEPLAFQQNLFLKLKKWTSRCIHVLPLLSHQAWNNISWPFLTDWVLIIWSTSFPSWSLARLLFLLQPCRDHRRKTRFLPLGSKVSWCSMPNSKRTLLLLPLVHFCS